MSQAGFYTGDGKLILLKPRSDEKRKKPLPTVEQWDKALKREGQGSATTEKDGAILPLGQGESSTLQLTGPPGHYTLRIGIADEATLAKLIVATNWDVQVALSEGAKGAKHQTPPNQATFTVPRLRIPVKGAAIAIHSVSTYVQVINQSAITPDFYNISAELIERRPIEDTMPFENNSGGDAPIWEFSYAFNVSVPGGVQIGDNIEVRDYAGALLATYPAREGGVWGVNMRAAVTRYVPAGPVVSNLLWTFFRRV